MAGNKGSKYYDVFLDYKIWLTKKGGHEIVEHTHFMLLEKISQTGSIAGAAEAVGMSYRKAWGMLRDCERELGFPLVETLRGGSGGGSTVLSHDGLNLLLSYSNLRRDMDKLIKENVRAFFRKINEPLRLFVPFLLGLILLCSCNGRGSVAEDSALSGDLVIFHAGSLAAPFKAITDSFTSIHPKVRVLAEASGSIDAARKITELRRDCDLMASADYAVIENLLLPEYGLENIRFATNEMAIVYTNRSRYRQQIDTLNWAEILSRDDVAVGRSDPDADPCGYRTLLTLRLARNFYDTTLLREIEQKDKRFIRPKETDLLALLDAGAVDYIFLYRSVAIQHNLPYLELPHSINLGDPDYNDFYSKASVEVRGSSPSEKMIMKGEAMVYGITRLKNAPNPKAAEAFIEYLLSAEGGAAILERMGQKPYSR
ncbi:MAG: extracellular solute-binding protein [Bacteroidia bacterium]|jgi:molybdate/tungstate transport system substrate-binding protein|nr:extracellular solute-binding protein [Bacteroidia bacterium]